MLLHNQKWVRRDTKKKNEWYKKHLKSNRKALEVIIQAGKKRLKND